MTAPVIDAAVAGRHYTYDIGHKRLDGKFNVWKKVELLPQQFVWVVVYVAHNWRDARGWIIGQEKTA